MLIALLVSLMLDGPVLDGPAPADQAATTPAPPVEPAQQPPVPTLRLPVFVPAGGAQKAIRFLWREHPSVRSTDIFRIDFAAKFQYDGRAPGDDPQEFEPFEVHRMRIGIEGELFQHIQYQVERELSERETNDPLQKSTKTPWKDVWVEANYTGAAQVRVGKFKVPFGLDQTSGESNLDFIYRSLGGSYLAPGRDIGGMVHGRFFARALNYWGGVFKQDGDNSRSSKIAGADRTIAARLTVTPFRFIKAAGLDTAEIGGSFTTSTLSDESTLPNGLRARTVLSQFTFFEPMFVKGDRRRIGADLDWLSGPFGARAEYTYVTDTREDQGLRNEDLNDVEARAWYVLGTLVLTGEPKTRPVEPRRGLFMGGFGAVEVAARFDRLWFSGKPGQDPPFRNSRAETIAPSGDRILTLGVNWYLNRWVKFQFNAIREQVEDVERSPIVDGSAFWSPIFRLQLEL